MSAASLWGEEGMINIYAERKLEMKGHVLVEVAHARRQRLLWVTRLTGP